MSEDDDICLDSSNMKIDSIQLSVGFSTDFRVFIR